MSGEARLIASASVDRIAWLVGFAGLLSIPVVAVEENPERNGNTEERVAAQLPDGALVAQKDAFSLVACSAAVDAIRETQRRTLVVTGFETDVCVAQSAVELLDLAFRVVIPADLTYTSSAAEHRRGLERALAAGAEPNSFKGIVFEWLRTLARADEF